MKPDSQRCLCDANLLPVLRRIAAGLTHLSLEVDADHADDGQLEDQLVVQVQRLLVIANTAAATTTRPRAAQRRRDSDVTARRRLVEHAQVEVVECRLAQVLKILRRVLDSATKASNKTVDLVAHHTRRHRTFITFRRTRKIKLILKLCTLTKMSSLHLCCGVTNTSQRCKNRTINLLMSLLLNRNDG